MGRWIPMEKHEPLHPPRHQYAFPRVEQSQDSHTYDTLLPFIPLHCPSHLVRTDTHIREKEKRREEIRAEKLSLLLRIRGWMLFGSWSPLLSWIEPRKAKRGRGGRGGLCLHPPSRDNNRNSASAPRHGPNTLKYNTSLSAPFSSISMPAKNFPFPPPILLLLSCSPNDTIKVRCGL